MRFAKMRLKEYCILILLIAIGYSFAVTQKYYISDVLILRSSLLLLVSVFLMLVFFFIARPSKPLELSKTLSRILGITVAAIILIEHFILTFTPSVKNVIVFVIAVIVPFICGFIYQFIKKYFN